MASQHPPLFPRALAAAAEFPQPTLEMEIPMKTAFRRNSAVWFVVLGLAFSTASAVFAQSAPSSAPSSQSAPSAASPSSAPTPTGVPNVKDDLPTTSPLSAGILDAIRKSPIGSGARIGVFVKALDNQEILLSIGADESLKPASCFKLFTTAAALGILGPDFTWTTDISISGPIRNGILEGSVILTGQGDPSIGGRYNPKDTRDLTWQMRDWARQIKDRGIRRIRGDVIGDDDFFGDDAFGRGWYPDERAEWYCAEVSALSFNDACIDILWKGGPVPNSPVTFTLNPPTKFCQVANFVRTVDAKADVDLRYLREETSNFIRAEGVMPAKGEKYGYAAIHNPTLFTAWIFKETLEREGIAVGGRARDIDEFTTKTAVRENLRTVVTHTSPPLSEIVRVVNRNSQNLYAELVLRTFGKRETGEGTFESGCRALEGFLSSRHLLRNGFCAVDGSGLSYFNRTTARMLGELLASMDLGPERDLFADSLPRGGERGTLKSRFQDDDASREAGGRIYGKTGYIGGVHSMSGYIEGRRRLAFSIILNDFSCSDTAARNLVDRIALDVAKWDKPEEKAGK